MSVRGPWLGGLLLAVVVNELGIFPHVDAQDLRYYQSAGPAGLVASYVRRGLQLWR